MYERVVYISRASAGTTPRTAYDIIRSAHNRNSQHGLTGGLLLLDGWFVQVLEGERYRVRERFAVIERDPRHTDVDVRERVQSERLLFPDEWMALRHDADVPETLRRAHGYRPGMPRESFTGAAVAAFVLACCSQRLQPA